MYQLLGKRGPICLAFLLAVLLPLAVPVSGNAQTVGGTILGTISDQSGAVIPGVVVTVKNVATGVVTTLTTNDAGFYSARNLLPGTYEVTASMAGFATSVERNVILTVGSARVANLQMRVGEVSQSVEVVGAAPSLELSSSILSYTVEGGAIRELPLNGRSWDQLATLQPGVIASGGGGTQTGLGMQLTISGGRPTENNYRLNGISISDYANSSPGSALGLNLGVDAIREFSVLTSTFSAEYGRASGGVVNAATRSGANALHGSVSYFHRNSGLDARNFFDVNPKTPPFRRHQFGGTLGGPIHKNRTFFFAAYEGVRQSLGSTSQSTVLSAAARQGLLSTGTVKVDPAIASYLNLFPLPNGQLLGKGDTGQYIWAPTRVSVEDYATGRIDHRFSNWDSINGTYSFDDGNINNPDTFNQMLVTSASRQQSLGLEEVHLFSPQTMNSLRLGFSRSVAGQNLTMTAFDPRLEDPSLGFIPGRNLGSIQVTGLTSHGGGVGSPEANFFHYNSYQGYDSIYLTRGRLSLKLGFSVERLQDNFNLPRYPNGLYVFSSLPDFLTNRPYQFTASMPGTDTVRGLRQTIFAAYVQNDMRLRSNLSVNLGLRYEMATVPNDDHGRIASLANVTDAQATVGLAFNNNTLRNFSPRVGLAWDPFNTGKTSIRAGFGLFDVLPTTNTFRNRFPRTTPFFRLGFANLQPGDFPNAGYPKLGPQTFRTIYLEPNPPRSYKMQWNLNVQRDLGKNMIVEIGYVGAHGVHLPKAYEDIDIVMPTLTANGYVWPATATSQRTNNNFGRIAGTYWNVDTHYHALQSSVKKTLGHGLQAQASYTFGKNLDNGSNVFGDDEYSATIANPYPFDTRSFVGRSDFDLQHAFVLNFLWGIRVPASWSWKGPVRWLLDDWQLGGIYTKRSGLPFNVILAADQAGTKNSQVGRYLGERPNWVGGPNCVDPTNSLPGNINSYLNVGCFSFPAPLTLGNFGRNVLSGPGLSNLDFSMFKNHRARILGEDGNVQFRTEFFNAINHTNFTAPGYYTVFDNAGRIVSGTGRITSARTSRMIQFGLKIVF